MLAKHQLLWISLAVWPVDHPVRVWRRIFGQSIRLLTRFSTISTVRSRSNGTAGIVARTGEMLEGVTNSKNKLLLGSISAALWSKVLVEKAYQTCPSKVAHPMTKDFIFSQPGGSQLSTDKQSRLQVSSLEKNSCCYSPRLQHLHSQSVIDRLRRQTGHGSPRFSIQPVWTNFRVTKASAIKSSQCHFALMRAKKFWVLHFQKLTSSMEASESVIYSSTAASSSCKRVVVTLNLGRLRLRRQT